MPGFFKRIFLLILRIVLGVRSALTLARAKFIAMTQNQLGKFSHAPKKLAMSSKRKAASSTAVNRSQRNTSLEEDCTASSEGPAAGPADETNKRLREQAASFSEDCACSITHVFMGLCGRSRVS
jgi:hypothetical protein